MKKLDARVFGQRLREVRLSKGWTQSALGLEIGLTDNSTISHYEAGRRAPNLTHLCALANVLHVTIDSLVTP